MGGAKRDPLACRLFFVYNMSMHFLIFGAGVIGCLYAAKFSEAGYRVTIYARGNRLKNLQEHGLLYRKGKNVCKADVNVISRLENSDAYDYVFLAVRGNQLYDALYELSNTCSRTIVTMVNSIDDHRKWEEICGKGKILPAFPGAGGSFDGTVLNAALTPRIIQRTTFAEIGGKKTQRAVELAKIFRRSKIPFQRVKDMHAWQLCHLALVVPIADAYYEAERPDRAGYEHAPMRKTASRIKENLRKLKDRGICISPEKLNVFKLLPTPLLGAGLSCVFKSNFGDIFMYRHSLKAPDEMHRLRDRFYQYLETQE